MTTTHSPRLAALLRGLAAGERKPYQRLSAGEAAWLALAALAAVAFDYFRYPALFGEAAVFDDNAYWLLADRHSPFIRFLFLPDGHYLSIFSRAIVGIPVALGFQPDQIGLFLQSASSAARGLLLGIVLLAPFRALLGNAACRLALFAFLILFGDYQLRLVYNLGYSQIVFLFFALLLPFAAAGRAVHVVLAIACVAALTKITVLVLLPVAVLAAILQRGTARWLLAALAAGMLANLGVGIATGAFQPSPYTSWLIDASVSLGERLQTALYLAPATIAFLAGLPIGEWGLAPAVALGAAALLGAGVVAARSAGPFAGVALVATMLGYAAGAAWFLTRIANLGALETLGTVRYHLFPLYALGGVVLLLLVAAAAQALLRGPRLARAAAGIAAAAVFLAFFGGKIAQRGMPGRDSAYHLLTGAGYWREMAALLDFARDADFCIAVPNTFPHLVGPKGGCPQAFAQPIESRLVAAPLETPEREIAIEVSAVAGPPRKVLAFGVFLRAAGYMDESVRFTVTLERAGRRETFEAIRTVKAAGSFAFFHLPAPLADVARIAIRPHGNVLVFMDEKTKKPWTHLWSSTR